MVIHGYPENIQDVTAQLSHPAPLLESLRIEVDGIHYPEDGPVIATALFNGDLSSLHDLYLRDVPTELPWRNMVNPTSFALAHASRVESSVGQLLDFFESAPRLRKIQLHPATPTSGIHGRRSVSLACLKRMDIVGGGSPALLLDHLLIPVDAKLATQGDHRQSTYLLRSLEIIRNLTGFRVHLHVREIRHL